MLNFTNENTKDGS